MDDSEVVIDVVADAVIHHSDSDNNISVLIPPPTGKKKKSKNKNKNKKKKNATQKVSCPSFQISEQDVETVLDTPDSINAWFNAYQTAFQLENQFIDNLNQSSPTPALASASDMHGKEGVRSQGQSSQSLGLEASTMMPLVFLVSGKDAARFRRVCFFVRECFPSPHTPRQTEMIEKETVVDEERSLEGEVETITGTVGSGLKLGVSDSSSMNYSAGSSSTSTCIVAYATVDEDVLQPGGVCHIRMLLVDPSFQRRGIGTQLLRHVVKRFSERSLGLKFANCHDYSEFYSSVGFSVIGRDKSYTYMAIRR
jgi:ribosomal protein S18 acetylase RimI-like enzyme